MNRALLLVALLSSPLVAQTTPCLAASDNLTFLDNVSMGGPNLLVGIRSTTGNTAITVFAAEVFTGEGTGANTLGIWTHDQASNAPGFDLGTGSFSMARPNGWQGANLPAPVTIPANTTFWLVWGPQNGAQSSVEGYNTSTGQTYRGSFDGGQSWNGPWVNYDWKFRLWCSPRFFAGFDVFGSTCPGSGRTAPRIGATAMPVAGTTFSLTLAGAQANVVAYACLGYSDIAWGGTVPLPFDLGPVGAPGCRVYVDLMTSRPVTTDATGGASLPLVVPNQPVFLGGVSFAQWVAQDAAANSLGLVTSDAARMTIGM